MYLFPTVLVFLFAISGDRWCWWRDVCGSVRPHPCYQRVAGTSHGSQVVEVLCVYVCVFSVERCL